jgi:soluble lytic murein transglycosylase
MKAGDCAAVVAALPTPQSPIERLAAGRCLEKTGEAGRAIEVLQGVDGPLAPFARMVRARAHLARDRPAEAVDALSGVSLPGSDEELLRARALVSAGRAREADALLTRLQAGPSRAEALWWRAKGEERKAALTTLRALWAEEPTSPWATQAEDQLARWASPVPDVESAEGRALMMRRAKALLAAQQAKDAIPLLDAIHGRAPFASTAQVLFMAGALFDAKEYARARDWYDRGHAEGASAKLAFEAALSTARAGDYDGAAVRYRALVKAWPGTPQADEAAWKPAYMDHDAGRLEEAVRGFATYLGAAPDGKFAPDARWLRAWDLYRLGRSTEAIPAFDEVIRRNQAGELTAAARYWKARATGSDAGLAEVIEKSPDSGYAFFAAARLGRHWNAQPTAAASLSREFVAAHRDLATAELLVAGGMGDWARPLLDDARKDATGPAALGLAALYVEADGFREAQALACPQRSAPAGRALCLPRPHHEVVTAIAREHGLHPLLPFAIMNAESGLDPSVVSPAGAMGLMQLMPRLAAELAQGRVPNFVAADLFHSGVNARLGTTELGLLARHFERASVSPNLPLVIASYNGGSGAVDRWLGGYPTPPDADRFAEDISFTETRRYVRRVLGFLQQYRRVYGDP